MMEISEKMKEFGLECPTISLDKDLDKDFSVDFILFNEMSVSTLIVNMYYKIIRLELLSFERSKTGVPGYIDVKAINLEAFEVLKQKFPGIGMKLVENE